MKKRLIPLLVAALLTLSACATLDSNDVSATDAVSSGDMVVEVVQEQELERDSHGRLKYYAAMLEQYPNMVGWITVPNTIIDYPVVQGQDNDYYLTHDYKNDENRNGAVYVDFRARIGLNDTSRCVVIHGHHMRSGIMFQNIIRYDDPEFYAANPVIKFDSIYNPGEWLIFAEMKIDAYGGEDGMPTFNFMQFNFDSDEDFMSFVSDIRAHSVYDTSSLVDVTASDQLLILSTCSYEFDDCRTVLAARRLRFGETPDLTGVTFAENPIMPPAWGSWEGHL